MITLKLVKSLLRNNFVKRVKRPVLAAYIVGSEAKGIARPDSDLDIAVVVPQHRTLTSIQYTERYHAAFTSNLLTPKLGNREVDFQFFFPGELEQLNYSMIEVR